MIFTNKFLKQNILFYFSFLLTFTVMFTSCNDDDTENVFGDPPAIRAQKASAELLNTLLSQPNGYRAVYFTKDDERGGFTIFMQFNEDGTVIQTSDFDENIDLEESSFEVRPGTTNAELVFTTRNHITKGVDPTSVFETINGEETGLGFFGTNLFQYWSNDNGVLTFRDVRNSDTAEMKLYPTNYTDFNTESIAAVNVNRSQIPRIAAAPLYQVLEFNNTQGTTSYNMVYSGERRFAETNGISADGNDILEINFGIAYTEDGITVSPAIEFEGQSYVDFVYDETNEQFVSEVNGTTAIIYYSEEPGFINPNDLEELANDHVFLYRDDLGINDLTNPNFVSLHEQVKADTNAILNSDFEYVGFQLNFNFDDDNCETFIFSLVNEVATDNIFVLGTYCFERAVKNDGKIFLTYTGPDTDNPNSAPFESPFLPLINFIENNQGLTFQRTGGFTSSAGNFGDNSATLTGRDNNDVLTRVYGIYIN